MDNVNIYKCKDGRLRVYLKDTKKVISYPKYIMEKHLGRELLPNEQVHHKDENPLNNDLDNLEIRLLGEHQKEHSQKYFDKYIKCEYCQKEFLWTAEAQRRHYSDLNRKIPKAYVILCSKQCIGKYGKEIQLKKNKK